MEFWEQLIKRRTESMQAVLNQLFNTKFDSVSAKLSPPVVMVYPYILQPNVCAEAPTNPSEVMFDLWVNMNTGNRFRCDGKPFFVSGVV